MLFGSKKVLGLDIGSSTIKLAEVDVSRGRATLNSFLMAPTPEGSVIGGDIIDQGLVSSAIAALVQELGSKRKSAAAGLWGSSIIVKKISIPRIDEKIVGEQIRWEAEQYIPFDINEVSLAFKILKGIPQSAETMEILIVAVRNEQSQKYIEIVESAGLKCSILDVGGFALANCFEQNYGVAEGQAVALLNIGASVTNLVIVDSGDVLFCRDIPVGGLTYTGEIQKSLSMSFSEAETMKLSVTSGQAAPDEVLQNIESTHEIVVDEIQGSFDFFLNTNANTTLKRCFITGGGSRTPGLLEQIGRATNVKCDHFDVFRDVKLNSRNISDGFAADIRDFAAIAIGLGMRSLGDE